MALGFRMLSSFWLGPLIMLKQRRTTCCSSKLRMTKWTAEAWMFLLILEL